MSDLNAPIINPSNGEPEKQPPAATKPQENEATNINPAAMEADEVDFSQITEADLELKSFNCPRCQQEFSTTNDLFQHMRDKYDDPTVCQLCGKNLNCMANILSHSYLHQGIKPYKCPKCKYETRTRFNLRVHFGSCAKIEKFEYKRGVTSKKRKLPGNKHNNSNASKRRRTTKNSRKNARLDNFVVGDDELQHSTNSNQTGSHNHYDLLDSLANLGPCTQANRDISCLIQVHIQHFPRDTNLNVQTPTTTDSYYPQHQQQMLPATDVSQFYPPATEHVNLQQTPSNTEQIQFVVSNIEK